MQRDADRVAAGQQQFSGNLYCHAVVPGILNQHWWICVGVAGVEELIGSVIGHGKTDLDRLNAPLQSEPQQHGDRFLNVEPGGELAFCVLQTELCEICVRARRLQLYCGGGGTPEAKVSSDYLVRRTVDLHLAVVQQNRPCAQIVDRAHIVADEEHGASLPSHIAHLSQALLLEGGVPNGENFVDQENLRLEVRRDGEGQAGVHAARVMLDRRLQEFFDLGEGDDLIEPAIDLTPLHAEDRAIEIDVLPAGQLGVEAGADFQQAADAAGDLDFPLGRLGDAREDLEQRALAGAVAADDADHFATVHLEAHVL